MTEVERVLGIELTEEQLEYVKVGWNAFYNNPSAYEGSVVVDMVKLGLDCKPLQSFYR